MQLFLNMKLLLVKEGIREGFKHKLMGVPLISILPEIIFSIIIISLCLLIFFKTKDLYNLSKYEGIKYFRNTFIYFSIAFLCRLVLSFNIFINGFRFQNQFPILVLSLVFMFSSFMAILSLGASVFYKEIKNINNSKNLELNLLLITIISICLFIIFKNPLLIIYSQLIIIFISVGGLIVHHNKISISKIKVVYLLLFLFWSINLLMINPTHLLYKFRFILYLLAILIFSIISYKTIKYT